VSGAQPVGRQSVHYRDPCQTPIRTWRPVRLHWSWARPVDTSDEGQPPAGDVRRAVSQTRPPGHPGPGGTDRHAPQGVRPTGPPVHSEEPPNGWLPAEPRRVPAFLCSTRAAVSVTCTGLASWQGYVAGSLVAW